MSSHMNKKQGMEIIIGVGKPKRPELPFRLFGGKPEAEPPMRQEEEDNRAAKTEACLERIERRLEQIAELMGLEKEEEKEEEDDEEEYGG